MSRQAFQPALLAAALCLAVFALLHPSWIALQADLWDVSGALFTAGYGSGCGLHTQPPSPYSQSACFGLFSPVPRAPSVAELQAALLSHGININTTCPPVPPSPCSFINIDVAYGDSSPSPTTPNIGVSIVGLAMPTRQAVMDLVYSNSFTFSSSVGSVRAAPYANHKYPMTASVGLYDVCATAQLSSAPLFGRACSDTSPFTPLFCVTVKQGCDFLSNTRCLPEGDVTTAVGERSDPISDAEYMCRDVTVASILMPLGIASLLLTLGLSLASLRHVHAAPAAPPRLSLCFRCFFLLMYLLTVALLCAAMGVLADADLYGKNLLQLYVPPDTAAPAPIDPTYNPDGAPAPLFRFFGFNSIDNMEVRVGPAFICAVAALGLVVLSALPPLLCTAAHVCCVGDTPCLQQNCLMMPPPAAARHRFGAINEGEERERLLGSERQLHTKA